MSDPPMTIVLEVDVDDENISELRQTNELIINWEDVAPAPEGWSEVNAEVQLRYSNDGGSDYRVEGELR